MSDRLSTLAARFPPDRRSRMLRDLTRQHFHLRLVTERVPRGGRVVDVGGGVGLFSIAVRDAGYDSILVDDFQDNHISGAMDDLLFLHRELGVRIVSRDVVRDGLDMEPESIDLVTAFETMEHWHNSPKRLFSEVVQALKPGGWFILSCPNCVSIRRRVSVPFGRGKWTTMQDWYETPTFRGHVREPDVEDLYYIAEDMGLDEVSVLGRNWRILLRAPKVPGVLADRLLRLVPTLSTDIYMIGRKPIGRSALTGHQSRARSEK